MARYVVWRRTESDVVRAIVLPRFSPPHCMRCRWPHVYGNSFRKNASQLCTSSSGMWQQSMSVYHSRENHTTCSRNTNVSLSHFATLGTSALWNSHLVNQILSTRSCGQDLLHMISVTSSASARRHDFAQDCGAQIL